MSETKLKNPFRYSVMVRTDTCTQAAQRTEQLLPNEEYSDRRRRERGKKLMEEFKKNSKTRTTGSGHIDRTENESIFEYLVNQQEHSYQSRS